MADYSTKRFFTYFFLKLKSFLFSKDVLSFLVFLLLSASFWFVNTLNKDRELELTIPVSYTGIPQDIMFVDQLPAEINVKVKDLGKNLWYYMTNKLGSVNVNFTQTFLENGLVSVPNTGLHTAINDKLLPTSTILEINPENIVSKYIRLYSRTVPVELIADISPESQFMLSRKVEPVPDKIDIFGPKAIIDEIKSVPTEKLVVSQLKDTLRKTVLLVANKDVRYSVDKVSVDVYVEMFTERKVILPVQIINCPENIAVRTFPAETKAVFNIGVSHFKFFDPNDIQIILDYEKIAKSNLSKQKLQVINHKPYISNVRIYPDEVEFLLEKKE